MAVNRALRLNEYPRLLIARHSRQQSSRNQINRSTERDTVANITLHYIQGVSEHIRRVLACLNIRVSLYPLLTLRRLLMRPRTRSIRTARKALYTESIAEIVAIVILARVAAHYTNGLKSIDERLLMVILMHPHLRNTHWLVATRLTGIM